MKREEWDSYFAILQKESPHICRALRIESINESEIRYLEGSVCRCAGDFIRAVEFCEAMLKKQPVVWPYQPLVISSSGVLICVNPTIFARRTADKSEALSILPLPLIDAIWAHFDIRAYEDP